MKSKAIVLMTFLLVIAVSFVTQKSSARQSAKIKDTTRIAPSVSVRERFLGTWELVSTEYRYTDGRRRPYPDVGPHGKGCLMYALDGHVCAQLINPRPARKEAGHPTDAKKISAFDGFFGYCRKYKVDGAKHVMMHLPDVASWPGFAGSKQPRPYTFSDSGDLLTFSGKELDEPGAESYSITWRKMGVTPKPSPVAD
jgi:Lipocalin-like domain